MNSSQELDRTQPQLKILQEINQICSTLSCNLWLRGGWAIDFLLGKITRSHSDIDLVTLLDYRENIEQALVNAGFDKIPVSDLQTDFYKNKVDVSLIFVKLSEDGRIVANGFPNWVRRTDSLTTKYYKLQDISIHVLSPGQLLEEKLVYKQGTGRKPRPKDLESIRIIQGIIESGEMDNLC